MTYFQNIHSLAELKKQYRTLALDNHPDKGGSTEIMQQINAEFTRLYAVWKDDTTVSATASGYESDYAGATAEEYADYVYNEYRWTGSNYKGQHAPEVVELVRTWLKETYPRYKFSVRRPDYNSIHISLMQADFEAFTAASGVKTYADINHYHIDSETDLTERAREVMTNVCAFVQSYNFDDSVTEETLKAYGRALIAAGFEYVGSGSNQLSIFLEFRKGSTTVLFGEFGAATIAVAVYSE